MIQKNRVLPRALFLACLAAVLTACGGGGASEDAIDKYVGVWVGCQPSGVVSAPWTKATLTLAKTGASSVAGTLGVQNAYTNSTCTAQVASFNTILSTSMTIVGSGTVQGSSVDKVSVVVNGVTTKDILFRSGNQLFTGGIATLDAEGYSTTFSPVYNKQ